jgi:hypothetical protein
VFSIFYTRLLFLLFSFKNKKRDIENYSGASAGRLLAYRAPLFLLFEKNKNFSLLLLLLLLLLLSTKVKRRKTERKGEERLG